MLYRNIFHLTVLISGVFKGQVRYCKLQLQLYIFTIEFFDISHWNTKVTELSSSELNLTRLPTTFSLIEVTGSFETGGRITLTH